MTIKIKISRKYLCLFFATLMALICAELIARYGFGLGDPPLFTEDEDIEYLQKPSMTYQRFGYRFHVNDFGMRSEDFPRRKSNPSELRVLIMGDSVINGGAIIEQACLATSILEQDLKLRLNRPIIVGNISCKSWGPPNLLAYSRRYGFFEADVVVVVLSSHDLVDVPTNKPVIDVSPDLPSHPPLLAVQELLSRYGRRLFESRVASEEIFDEISAGICLTALHDLIDDAKRTGASVLLVQHLERSELNGVPKVGFDRILGLGRRLNVPVDSLGPAFAEAMRKNVDPYLDEIHTNRQGQKIMADVLLHLIEPVLRARPSFSISEISSVSSQAHSSG